MILFNSQPRLRHNFTVQQHQLALQLLKANPMLYNRKELDFQENDDAKNQLLDEVVAQLKVSRARFAVWYSTMRSELGRLKRAVEEKGEDKVRMTVLQRRRWKEFDFMKEVITFRKRVVRVR